MHFPSRYVVVFVPHENKRVQLFHHYFLSVVRSRHARVVHFMAAKIGVKSSMFFFLYPFCWHMTCVSCKSESSSGPASSNHSFATCLTSDAAAVATQLLFF